MIEPINVLRIRAELRAIREENARWRAKDLARRRKQRQPAKPTRVVESIAATHGTYACYRLGCRCDPCRRYQNDRVARNRRERFERLSRGDGAHGLLSSYDAGCRCHACRTVKSEAHRREPRRYAIGESA